jgi:hypothetical protein
MPEHLKLTDRKDQKVSSMPPKTRIQNEETIDKEDTTTENNTKDKLEKPNSNKPLKIDPEVEQEIRNRRRTGSTGGSSAKEAEIIKREHKKNSGSPSPSPIGHPQFPMAKPPLLKHVLASNNPHITISDSNSSNNTNLNKERKINNSKIEIPQKKVQILKNPVDLTNLFKNVTVSKKHKNHKGISQTDLSSGTPIGIGNIGPPPISIGFGLPRGRHKKAATAFDYENLNSSFQVDKFRHNTITATPSHRARRKRKGSKKVRVSCDLNQSLVLNSKGTPLSKKKMMSLMNSTINNQILDISARPVSVLNKTIYTTGIREGIQQFPSLMLQKKKKKKFRVRSRGESPKNVNIANSNLYLAYMRGNNSSKVKSSIGYNSNVLNNSMSLVRAKKPNYSQNRKITLNQTSKVQSKK